MTQDEIIEMAKQAGLMADGEMWFSPTYGSGDVHISHLESFAKLIAEKAIKETLEQPEQEPVAMRMPKVGDKVICIEDDSLGEVKYLTAGGSPEIKFDDGSHGTYMLREFAELFRYATTPHTKVGCAECGVNGNHALYCVACAEKYLEDKNTKGQK